MSDGELMNASSERRRCPKCGDLFVSNPESDYYSPDDLYSVINHGACIYCLKHELVKCPECGCEYERHTPDHELIENRGYCISCGKAGQASYEEICEEYGLDGIED